MKNESTQYSRFEHMCTETIFREWLCDLRRLKKLCLWRDFQAVGGSCDSVTWVTPLTNRGEYKSGMKRRSENDERGRERSYYGVWNKASCQSQVAWGRKGRGCGAPLSAKITPHRVDLVRDCKTPPPPPPPPPGQGIPRNWLNGTRLRRGWKRPLGEGFGIFNSRPQEVQR